MEYRKEYTNDGKWIELEEDYMGITVSIKEARFYFDLHQKKEAHQFVDLLMKSDYEPNI